MLTSGPSCMHAQVNSPTQYTWRYTYTLRPTPEQDEMKKEKMEVFRSHEFLCTELGQSSGVEN